ncbi:hypothetical protein P4829_10655 [Bacillus atrophaeus]|uniref:hypothetical protein n=1 Tax=Bacillus atrophaeus TaxID=1452 RepID=UPI0007C4BD6B|nr:hypothetical protein [Bacillus atrophaeus]MDS9995353.1 hypothetical protein [Bacillus atrophaeus]WFE12438.1 hypothetical protein P4829_10655 [Bacillus atrophaeus]
MNSYYTNTCWFVPCVPLLTPSYTRQQEPRRFDLSFETAAKENLGNGFTRYTWNPEVKIRRGEFIDFRLEAKKNEHVISAGFNTSRPLQNVSIVQLFPRHPHVMVIILHNEGTQNVDVSVWVVVKTAS